MPDLYVKISGFQDSTRKFICHVVGITFQSISKHLLCELLGNIDGKCYIQNAHELLLVA